MDEQSEKLKMLSTLAKSFNKEYPPEVYEMWLDALLDYSVECLKKAIKELVLTCKFMPSICQLTDKALAFQMQEPPKHPDGPVTPEAEGRAWLEEQDAYADEDPPR